MVVTPFGDLALDDEVALARWLDAHARRHSAYTRVLGTAGGTMRGEVDADWMLRHALRHIALCTVIGKQLASADTKVLLLLGKWRTEAELQEWHDLHNRLHLLLDQQLVIS